tara:strand:- start:315 stop:2312 length:1998 start_codon:yes stop_codon:yes gene_type:complete
MPSTVYKGDLTEVTFGHETGVVLPHDYAGSFKFIAKAGNRDLVKDTSIITFSGGAASTPVNNGILAFPIGMLVGSKVVFSIKSTSPEFSTDDDFSVSGRSYTIIKHAVVSSATELTITPALKVDHSSAKESKTNDVMEILPFATPSMDVSMTYNATASSSAERVLTDQFVGLVNTISLPETRVDLKRYHVVGLGRDVAVQVPGRFLNTGGSFESNMHNARWMYYCLGHEATSATGGTLQTGGATFLTDAVISQGDSSFTYDGGSSAPTINGASPAAVGAGDYVIIADTNTTDIKTYRETASDGTWPTNGANSILSKAVKQEIRRIVAISDSSGSGRIWVDDPLNFSHADNTSIKFLKYEADSTRGSPHMTTTNTNYGLITNPVERILFSRTNIPSFAMEVSIRRRDTDSNEGTTDGSNSDSKQLTRVFRGCKVTSFNLTADTDAALRLTVDFDSALVYTDTGRLETGTKGDRYDTHRLFEDTANTEVKRKESGIAKRTQKPFMFYNGIITVAGVQVGQVVSFNLNGTTGVQQYYTVNGANVADSETDQVPFAGTRNPSLAVEGKTEYDLEMEIIVDDPVFYHKMRRAVDHYDDDTSDTTDADMIRLSFTKQGAGATRESIDIVMDDYFIVEAPLPIPEDKGPLRSTLKILPKTVHVIAKDTLMHS